VTKSLFKLIETLQKSFSGRAFADKHRIEMRYRRRRRDETLQTLYADIRRFAALAFLGIDYQAKESMAIDYFLEALGDSDFVLKIRKRQPENLDTALRIALQLEVWSQDTYRLRQTKTPRPAEAKKTREMTKTGPKSALKEKNEALQKKIAKAKKTIEDIRKSETETKKIEKNSK